MAEISGQRPAQKIGTDASVGSGTRQETSLRAATQRLKEQAKAVMAQEAKKAEITHTPLNLATIRKNINMYRRVKGISD